MFRSILFILTKLQNIDKAYVGTIIDVKYITISA